MILPFGSLSWENFERLCYRLALLQGVFDHVARYGRQGQAQEGIDVFARKPDGRYAVWQAKRYATYTPRHLRSAVKTFLAGRWVEVTDTFVIAVQASLDDTELQNEIEKQTASLADRKIALEILGGDALVERIRPHPTLVSSFFGRGWLDAFYGDALEGDLRDSLDGIEFAKLRSQLAKVYSARFNDLDQGMAGAQFQNTARPQRSLALLERFAMSDVLIRERTVETANRMHRPQGLDVAANELRTKVDGRVHRQGGLDEVRRLSAADWLSDGDQLAIIADAGAGKSTLLRAIALDLLGDQSTFAALGQRWGDRLPLILPFAKWAKATKLQDGEVGLKEVIAQTLQPLLTADIVSLVNRAVDERRIVLIIDGLDEWSAEQAARTALLTLLTYVQVHEIPTLVSGRPHGLRKIGALPQSWKTAELAPLSPSQQSYLANIWFRHLEPQAPEGAAVRDRGAAWRADRFLKELRTEAALGELAGTPLLFIGLLVLSICNMALPRNRAQALRDLVKLLIETHPEARATSAGEGRARFESAATPEVRHLALGALAFASRRDGGDAGYGRAEAFNAIFQALLDGGYESERSEAIATELLAVNSETVGLLVEKGPDEIGFAHASLEEYLAAVHIQSWPFRDLVHFVSASAGNMRWRNVLRNLVSINVRPDEIDEIVKALETAELDIVGDLNRRHLLAEIGFSPSLMRAQTALRLANRAFAVVEGFGLESERAAMVRLSINGLSDPILQSSVEDRLRRWVPRRVEYTSQIFSAVAAWPRSEVQLETLISGLSDENRSGARAAASGLAAVYKGEDDVAARLFAIISPQTGLEVVAGALEALVCGWPLANLGRVIDEAAANRSPLLQAMAILARVKLGLQTTTDREACLHLVRDRSNLGYPDSEIAKEALLSGWVDDDAVIEEALAAFGRSAARPHMDRDVAMAALLGCKPGRASVKAWLLDELSERYPLSSSLDRNWVSLVKFAGQDTDIHEAVVKAVMSQENRFRGYEHWQVIADLGDARLRDHAIAEVRSHQGNDQYWNLLPLLSGWANDPRVVDLVQEVISRPDNELGMAVALIPKLYCDPAVARARLIRILRDQPKSRADLIVRALIELGCDETDDEAVRAILPWLNGSNSFSEPLEAYGYFAAHPAVREHALSRLDRPEPPLDSLARGFPNEPKVREAVLAAVSAAPLAVRAEVAAAAGISGDRHPALYSVLEGYNEEKDFRLGVQLSVEYHQLRQARGDVDGLVQHLSAEMDRPGMDFEERRTKMFAGLIALDEPQAVLTANHEPGKIRIQSWRSQGVSSLLGALLVKKWDLLKSRLGSEFVTEVLSSDKSIWGDIARFASPYPDVRRDFLEWCKTKENIDLTELRTLAEFSPRSGVLHGKVLGILRKTGHRSSQSLPMTIAAAEILRDQFSTPEYVAELSELFEKSRDVHAAIALAILDPASPGLQQPRVATLKVGSDFGDWLAAAQIASRLDPAKTFVSIVHAMAEQVIRLHGPSQLLITEVLVERVVRDRLARTSLQDSLDGEATADAFVTSVAILARAGFLDSGLLEKCATRLASEQLREGVPITVFDISQNALRPYAHVLMDFFQPGGSN